MYSAECTNKHTPNDSNNVESNDFDAKRLLLFEHVRDTTELRSNNTRSHNLLVCKDDDASKGSDVFQPEDLKQVPRDAVNNIFGSMTCIVFSFSRLLL